MEVSKASEACRPPVQAPLGTGTIGGSPLVQASHGTGTNVSSSATAQSVPFIQVGAPVVIQGIASRKELNGNVGTIVVCPTSSEDRVAIKLPSGEKVRIKACNIKPSIFNPGFGYC